jgi:hypothetical protein
MKIEISEESFNFLKDLVHEMQTQDRACTADPYFYVVQEQIENPAFDGCGTDTRYSIEDGEGWETKESMLELIAENEEYDGKTLEDLIDEGIIKEYEITNDYENTSDCNVFFTKKGYDDHIKRNGHNLHCPRPYILHAFRNAEIENLFKAIKEIANNKKEE